MSRFLTTAGMVVAVLLGVIGWTSVSAQENEQLDRIGRDLDGILQKLDERGRDGDRVAALREAHGELEALLAETREVYRGATDRSGERERVEFHLRYLIRWTRYLLQKSGTSGEEKEPISGAEQARRRGLERLEAAHLHEREHPEDRVGIAERYLSALALLRGQKEEREILAHLNGLWGELDGGAGPVADPDPAPRDPTGSGPEPRAPTVRKPAEGREPGRNPTPAKSERPAKRKRTAAELKVFRKKLVEGTPAERSEAARVIATVPQSWVGGLLVQQLAREEDPGVKAVLVEEVLRVGTRHVVRALGKWSRAKDPVRRQEAITLLGRIGGKDVGPALAEFASGKDEATTRKLIETAKGLPRGYGVAALAKTGKAHPALRFEVIEALGQTRHADAAKVLISFLHRRKHGEYKDPAIKALRMLGPAGIPVLIDALDGRDYRQYAAVALRSVTGERFGMSRSRWVQWWRKNRKRFEKPDNK